MPGYVIDERQLEPIGADGDTASTKTTIDANTGCELIEQQVTRFAPGRSSPRQLTGSQEVMYVAAGRGTVIVDGRAHEVEPDTGVYIAPGESFEIDNPGPAELVIVSARVPAARNGGGPKERRTVHYADQPTLVASPNRQFRYLVTQDVGCLDVTQFVGTIPPGRAPDHSHTYDEVVYVVEGEGMLHIGEKSTPIAAGSCIHLPPLLEHCLENTGPAPMRVMGVFHPAGDPSSRAPEANQTDVGGV
ncbi:MAG: cupin domain-containing protein [Actinomycetota bacterium]|nr:cupin domain-containing protein [Actinomycetota bacterium]